MNNRTDLSDNDNSAKRTTNYESMTIATWNVEGIGPKLEELMIELEKQKIDITVVTETKKKGQGTIEIGESIFIYSGVEKDQRAQSGVGIIVKKSLKKQIISYSYINDRIIILQMKTGRSNCWIIGIYAPVEGEQEKTEKFYKTLQQCVNKTGKNDYVIIAGDANARVGKTPIPNLIGPNGEDTINRNGKHLRDWCSFNNMRITNTFFRHKEIHKFTWEARGTKSIIDYIMANEKMWPNIIDTRAYRGAEIDSDHYLVK